MFDILRIYIIITDCSNMHLLMQSQCSVQYFHVLGSVRKYTSDTQHTEQKKKCNANFQNFAHDLAD